MEILLRALQFHHFQPINVFYINSLNDLIPPFEHHSAFNYRCQKFSCAAIQICLFIEMVLIKT